MVRVAGIDLAGKPSRPTGITVIDGNNILFMGIKHTDREILDVILSYHPVVVAVDSPLKHARTYRRVDIVMKRSGYPVLPPGWRSMSMLVERAISLRRILGEHGIPVIETHPKSALKSSGCRSVGELAARLGIELVSQRHLSRDEADALIAAIVAQTYVNGKTIVMSAEDGEIHLLPRLCGEET